MIIHYKNYIYDIEELPNEPKQINMERCYIIVGLLNNNTSLDNSILYSNYFIYNKYYSCVYNDKIMNIIKNY